MIKATLHTLDQKQEALLFLEQDIIGNLYQISMLEESHSTKRLEWSAIYKNGKMIAVSLSSNRPFPGLSSGLSVPYGDPNGCQLLGAWEREKGGTRHILGERQASDAFYEGLGSPKTMIHCAEQLFYADFLPEEGTYLELRPAREEELDILLPMAAQMQKEDLGFDPLQRYEKQFITATIARIQEKRYLLAEEEGKTLYLIDVGTLSPRGAQVGSMFVPAMFRGKGYGTKGMRGCLKYLLPKSSFVSLIARESNIPAIRTHQKAGYLAVRKFRMIIMAS